MEVEEYVVLGEEELIVVNFQWVGVVGKVECFVVVCVVYFCLCVQRVRV